MHKYRSDIDDYCIRYSTTVLEASPPGTFLEQFFVFLRIMTGKVFLLLLLLVPWEIIAGKIPLSNDPGHRSYSDRLDSALGWGGYDDPRQSKVRATIHAAYHEGQYHKTGNPREHERAKDQWGVVTGGARDNLAKYDAQHPNK